MRGEISVKNLIQTMIGYFAALLVEEVYSILQGRKQVLISMYFQIGGMSVHRVAKEILQLFCPYGMLEFFNRFGLNLSDPFPSYSEYASNLFKRVCVSVSQAVS